MKLIVAFALLVAGLGGAQTAPQSALRDRLFAAADRFCKKVGWEFDPVARRKGSSFEEEAPGMHVYFLHTQQIWFAINPDNGEVIAASNGGYDRRRRKAVRHGPFVRSDAEWYQHARKEIAKFMPGLTLKNLRIQHFRIDDRDMRWSDSRTVRMMFAVIGPPPLVGHRITIIFDRDEGKMIEFSHSRRQ